MRKIGYAAGIEKQKIIIKVSIKLQAISILCCFVFLWFFFSLGLACSAVLGGLCSLIPNLSSIMWHFRHTGAQSAKKVLASIYLAEVIKFVLIICMLAIVYSISINKPLLSASGVLVGFIITYMSTLLMPIIAK